MNLLTGFSSSEAKSCLTNYIYNLDENISLSKGQGEYMLKSSIDFYRNYLEWFYQTFKLNDVELRKTLFRHLKLTKNSKILITGVGLGHELHSLLDTIQATETMGCEIYAQDISSVFINYIYNNFTERYLHQLASLDCKISLFNGDATKLPFDNPCFDYIHHFGGINRFSSMKIAISEMSRCLKPDEGIAMFSDECVAPWLRETDYGRMVMKNNMLYSSPFPIDCLPPSAFDVQGSFIIKNCFYMLAFKNSSQAIDIDPHVTHKSPRGGSMYTRYHGAIDGVSPLLREKLVAKAARENVSLNYLLEQAISSII